MRQIIVLDLCDVERLAAPWQLLVPVGSVPWYNVERREVLKEVVVIFHVFGVEAGEKLGVDGLERLAFGCFGHGLVRVFVGK